MVWNAPVNRSGGRKPGSKNKAAPDLWIPDALIRALSGASDAFFGAPKRSQLAAAHLIVSRASVGRYGHFVIPNCFYVKRNRLDELFGKDQFLSFNARTRVFDVYNYEAMGVRNSNGITYAYALSDWATRAFEAYLGSDQPTGFVNVRGGKMHKPKTQNVIPSRDKKGNQAARIIKIRHFVPVNTHAIRDTLDNLHIDGTITRNDRGNDGKRRIREQLKGVARLANNDIAPGCVPQRYIEAESGRLYGHGEGLHLQNVKREVKQIALAGNWEYDFSNSQYAIFEQLVTKMGYRPNGIREYLENKHQIRNELATLLDVPATTAKELLLMLLYSARKPTRRSPNSSILKALDHDWEKVDLFFSHRFVDQLKKDRSEGASRLLSQWPRSRATYRNAGNKFTPAACLEDESDVDRRNRILAHILQGAEARALNIACQPLDPDLLLLQHDGFTVSRRVDIDQVKDAIARSDLGLHLELEEEQLAADLWKQVA